MKVSIFTPTHDPKWLKETYQSVINQTYKDFEWIIVPNKCLIDGLELDDERIKLIPKHDGKGIGDLKRFACENCTGELLIELDHDDLLTPDALETIVDEYKKLNTTNAFLYSDSANFYDRKTGQCEVFSNAFGWESYPFKYEGTTYTVMKAFKPSARSLCQIYYAPNHVRVWSKHAYLTSGMHDINQNVGDDHDLMCRSYLVGTTFKHIEKCLYLYRVHGDNTYIKQCADIESQQTNNMNRYLYLLIDEWCKREGLKKLDLGAAHNKKNGFLGVDRLAVEGVDIVCDVLNGIPLPDNSVGWVMASDFIEHMPLGAGPQLFNEIYRILTPGGWFSSHTPSTDGRGAFQDPTHLSFWNSNSLWYYTNKDFAKYVPEIKCRFQQVRVWNDHPNDFCKFHNIVYVHSDMCALKGQREAGLALI